VEILANLIYPAPRTKTYSKRDRYLDWAPFFLPIQCIVTSSVRCDRVLDHGIPWLSHPGRPESRPGDYPSPRTPTPTVDTSSKDIGSLCTA
jgi:hypothetical protein